MSGSYQLGRKKRLSRMLRLLARIRPDTLPVTYHRNRVTLLPDGPCFFESLFTAIRSARCSLLLEYYLIRNDDTGRMFADELTAAVRRGVKVFLIYDYIGCIDTPSAYFRSLARNGIELIPFNVPSFKRGIGWFDRRDHRKMTVVDGQQAFLGGFNIGDEYAGGSPDVRFRDTGFCVTGSAVRELIAIFRQSWQMERGQASEVPDCTDLKNSRNHGRAHVTIISGGPHLRSSYIRSAFLFNIASASEELTIASPYFVPGPRIMRALLRAARRGVRVRLLMPARSDVPLVQLVGRSSYGTLLRGGVTIYELEREILHAKIMLVDGERAVIGSANLDQRSFHRNFEINCVVDSAAFGKQVDKVLEQEFLAARRVRLDDHEGRGFMLRAMEKVVNLFGWFL